MRFSSEYFVYVIAKYLGSMIRRMPVGWALALGRCIGTLGYHFDTKHRSLAYANLKEAFAETKSPQELKRITRKLFENFGQNVIELYSLPTMHRLGPEKFVRVEGKEHVFESLKKKKGVILLAMHFGSWEISSFMSTILGHEYKVIVKHQKRFSQLDELLNSYRECGGSVVVTRGRGTRELIESLHNNEVVGMVVDQGGRGGALIKFFERTASMSVGAIRMGLKLDVPICFSIMIPEKRPYHHLVIHQPLELINTGNTEADIRANLEAITPLMERYIKQYPSEYMWFYKIWKYSNQARIIILSDGKAGHLRQSETMAKWISHALGERNITATVKCIPITFKNAFAGCVIKVLSGILPRRFTQGRIGFLRHFLTKDSFAAFVRAHGDFVISCGSSVAGLNFFLSQENHAKAISLLRPSLMPLARFNLTVLPRHDVRAKQTFASTVAVTHAAPNLITDEYLSEQAEGLLNRYSHLRGNTKYKIGVLLGGDTKDNVLNEHHIRIVLGQLKEIAERLDADIILTTSRRTSEQIENAVQRAMKSFSRCQLSIIANRNNIPEAVGGILGLSDVLVVTGDSISMVSEAASSGKSTIVLPVSPRRRVRYSREKHRKFIQQLNADGYVVMCEPKMVGHVISDVAKGKIKTKKLDDNEILLSAARKII